MIGEAGDPTTARPPELFASSAARGVVRPLSVLVVTNMWPSERFPKFGSFVFDAVGSMRRAGASVKLVAVTDPRGGRVRLLAKYAWLVVRCLAAAAAGGYDAVHAHFLYPTGAAAGLAARARGVPLIVFSHGSDVLLADWDWPVGPQTRRVAQRADAVVVPSLAHGAVVTERLDVPSDRILVAPIGADLDFFTPGDRALERRGLSLDPALTTLLFVGALDDNKGAGVEDVLRAMASPALSEAAGGPVELQVVGEGPRSGSLEELAARLGVSGHVRWRGWVDKPTLRSLLRAADVVVVPSRRESLGLVALEAAAVGTAVVAANVGGLPEHVRPGVTGELYEPGDPDGLVDAVGRTLAEVAAGTLRPSVDASRFGLASTGPRLIDLTRAVIAKRADARATPAPGPRAPDEGDDS